MIKNNNSDMLLKKYCIDYKKIFGFWLYLMSDCIIFATLFSVYIVMLNNTIYGPFVKDFLKLPLVFIETLILLFSSVSYGVVLIFSIKKNNKIVYIFLLITFLLGFLFCFLELYEFYELILNNFSPKKNGFLSSFFVLIGTHGLHVFSGLIWIIVMFYQILKFGLKKVVIDRLFCLGLFWHFLDIIWIFIFTFVYLFGAL
ncbi:cytochrome o ubiquinol oxidase subunit III [Buchnera aphidicola]|uniref:cytochrome o ubiquinol oxidase subunit III n=1 Tax=Buchnera aphidicola TaxID=9 RepID=UPI0031B85C8B